MRLFSHTGRIFRILDNFKKKWKYLYCYFFYQHCKLESEYRNCLKNWLICPMCRFIAEFYSLLYGSCNLECSDYWVFQWASAQVIASWHSKFNCVTILTRTIITSARKACLYCLFPPCRPDLPNQPDLPFSLQKIKHRWSDWKLSQIAEFLFT